MHLPGRLSPQRYSCARKADQATAQFTDFAADITTFLWHSDIYPLSSWNGNQFRNYCRHIIHSTRVSASVVILALKYISRLKHQRNYHQPRPGSEYHIFTIALLLANKFLEDQILTTQYWSKQSNISTAQLKLLEIEMLKGTDYSLYVSQGEYLHWLKQLEYYINLRHAYLQQCESRVLQAPQSEPESENPYAPQLQTSKSLYTVDIYPIIG
ncbi:hypothetical protein K493DRAFT_319039 [Basidiobolus meristosporus CBS 931.73]|uniref:Cyclin N-terminal domain-containing protein n=1 Tax=Basidiobolus meristosporus CBS 931.73 TaxID=1314790 RepID=A0A1Y1XTC7_9FUNG|nr:hypothetical protein K493DRAFT_319039 [Basidiobolus meristosporus CBS 931.73]|eukprot:ORX89002.1 hypothetical protein K493DRAFT_319039 [Basidiobolus meristosporus CBS 931.73]